jgi:O-acetyl-ADP-ribose deacetylase (regulator of RNase III)
VAFPSISTGIYGYPLDEAAPVALEAVQNGLVRNGGVTLCRFVLFDEQTLGAYEDAARELFV